MRISGVLTLKTEEMTRRDWRDLFERLTFLDAEGVEVSAYDHREAAGTVTIPRGALDMIPSYVERADRRSRPRMPKLRHVKPLDEMGFTGQKAALAKMFEREQGQVRLSTGGGKTTIGCAFVAGCGTRTLVVVHTKDLMRQWVERAREEIPGIDVGTIQGANFHVGHLTVATTQTLRERYLRDKSFWRRFGCLILDESQHGGNSSNEWILNACPAHYRFGLSASDKRSDGRQRLVRYAIGPVIYRARFRSQVPIEVQPVMTGYRSSYSAARWSKLVAELVRDEERNRLVARLAERESTAEHSVLVLSRQIGHLERIAEQFSTEMDGRYAIVTGRLAQRRRNEILDALRDGSLRCVLGTQLFEEGVDVPRLDRVVLAFPGTDVTTLQKVGRATRRFEGKRLSVILDVVDSHVPVLARQYVQRKHWYRKTARIPVRKATDGRREHERTDEDGGRRLRGLLRVRRGRRAQDPA